MARKLPKIISNEEFEKLLKAVDKVKYVTKKSRRQYKLAMLLAGEAGLRISEILGYERKDGKLIPKLTKDKIEVASIRIESGKGQKDRVVPRPKRLNDKAVKMLPLTIQRRALQHFITKLGKDIIGKDMSFHTLRHYFCTECIRKGIPLHQVQMFAGHSRLDTTGIYLHADPSEALKKYQEVF